jgi:rhamnogalacturonan endolyase
MPKMFELKEEIQDWTYRLADNSIYTKYNYADYIDGRYVHGMAGRQTGLGMFVIQASHEYLNGGPTKQFQNVHSNPYLINMFNCGHFLSDKRKGDNIIRDDWAKLDGPFLLYFNEGKNISGIWNDAKIRAAGEQKQWPYSWMQHKEYPLQRGTVKGLLMIDKKPAASVQVILAQPGCDWQAQSRDYIYSVHTTTNGSFNLDNVRPGYYSLYAYGANSTDEYQYSNIQVGSDKVVDLGILEWQITKAGSLLWQIGVADRKTTGFKLSDSKREYFLFKLPPADLQYSVEKNEYRDWYYAQTKKGSWDINFNLNKSFTGQSLLTIGIAGSAKNPTLEVWVNGSKAAAYRFGNDASVYRSAVAGGYYFKQELSFSSSLLKQGDNVISLKLPDVKDGGGIMYDVIKLEAN